MVKKSIILFIVALFVAVGSSSAHAKTFYLDGNMSSNITNGTYSIENRNSSGSNGDAYNNIQDAINQLAPGDTLFIRSGNYTRGGDNQGYGAFGVGSLDITVGSTTISGYGDEQPVIYTQAGKMNYNPNPTSMGTDGVRYYPWPAISVRSTSNVTIRGLKTYGQIAIEGSNSVMVENCDFGGGGPQLDQGIVVYLNTTSGVTVRNCKIHNSATSASAFQVYQTGNLLVERNSFYDNYGFDFNAKDTVNREGQDITFRYNWLGPSSVDGNCAGVRGINQANALANLYIYQNIFYKKATGVVFVLYPQNSMVVNNNTFINTKNWGLQAWFDTPINVFNNIFYSSETTGENLFTLFESVNSGNVNMNYNVYYSTAGGATMWKWGSVFTSLSAWRSALGKTAAPLIQTLTSSILQGIERLISSVRVIRMMFLEVHMALTRGRT
jgi:hypothetical protein